MSRRRGIATISFDFSVTFNLSEHEPLPGRKGRNHVDRRFSPFLVGGSPYRLAVDGDDLGRSAGQRRHPGDEALLELVGIQRREYVPQMVVGRRAIGEGQKPAQQVQFLCPETGDIGERLRARQHSQEAQKQHFLQRVHHLRRLLRVRQVPEMLKECNTFADRSVHRHHGPLWITGGRRLIQNFLRLSRPHSPDRPGRRISPY